MRNKILFFLTICFLFSSNLNFGQCPTAIIQHPDSACSGTPINFLSNSIGNNLIYEWDFNTSENYNNQVGHYILNSPSNLVSSLGFDMAIDNGQYYSFAINTNGNLTRFDFGNSIDNSPLITTLGNLGVLANCVDLRIISSNGNWYGITNTFSNQIIRIEFGNSLANPPIATILNIPTTLFNTPYYIDVKKIGNNFMCIVANYSGGNITVIDFGSDLQNNNPSAFNISVPFTNPISASVTADCDEIYGIVCYSGGFTPVLIDFGNSISSTPNSITPLNASTAMGYRKINIIYNDSSYLFLGQSFNGESIYIMNFGKHINNLNPKFFNIGNMNVLSSGFYTNSIKNIESSIIGFSTNYNSGDLIKFKFQEDVNENAFINHNQNPTITFDSTGFHYFSLTVKDTVTGLSNSISDSIYISPTPSASIEYSAICENTPVLFSYNLNNSCNIIESFWSISNGFTYIGDTAICTFTSSGNFNLSLNLTTASGCTTNIADSITTYSNPVAEFIFTDSVCSGNNILFSDSSYAINGSISNWSWNIDNIIYNSPICTSQFITGGLFPITLVVETNYGCRDTTTKNINILPRPIANFSVSNTCIGENTIFHNTTDSNSTIAVNYLWDLGNNQTTSLTNPIYQYPFTTNNYNVELIASSTNGCSDSIQKLIRIGNVPLPQFSISSDTICQNTLVQIADNSLAGTGETISGRVWDLGDGTVINDSIIFNHAYSNPGLYQISLKVISPTSCDSIIVKNIYVIESPNAQFSSTDACLGDTNSFIDLSTSPTGSVITNWNYNFGDNSQSILSNPSHIYTSAGTYSTSLIVTSDVGCSDTSAIILVNVYSPPVADFYFSKACTEQSIQFTDSSTGTFVFQEWKWNFGNNLGTSIIQNPSFIFNNNFAYPVQLICIENTGCSDTITKYIIVEKTPDFNINFNNNCEGITSNFEFLLNSSASTNLAYLWNFGDSTYSFQSNPQHIYTSFGNYPVRLETTDLSNGCSSSEEDTIEIYPNPISDFKDASACVDKEITLYDSTYISTGVIQSNFWNINNNYFLTGDSIKFIADTFGVYTISLLSITNSGCKDSITKSIYIYPKPDVSFTTNTLYGAPPLPIDFTATNSTNSYLWDFGDGSPILNMPNPSHIYYDTGSYFVNLVAITPFGCLDSNKVMISVYNPINDVAVIGNTIVKDNNKWILKALFKNEGNITINSLEIKLSPEGRNSYYERIKDLSIEPGETYEFNFNSYLDAKEIIPSYFCTEATMVNNTFDDKPENNNFCSTISDKFNCYNVYPNPMTNGISVGITLPKDGEVSIQLLSVVGDVNLRDYSYSLKRGYSTIYLDLGPPNILASGLYLLVVRSNEEENTIRLIKN